MLSVASNTDRRAVPLKSGRVAHRLAGIPIGLLLAGLVATVIVVSPVAITLYQAFAGGLSAAKAAIDATSLNTLLGHTVLVAAIAAPLCGVIGVTSAWFVERTHVPGRRIWVLLLVAPLTVPLFVTSYAWATLSTSLQGLVGAAGVIVFSYYPIVFLLVLVSLRNLDPALEETARSLGLSARRVFFRVVLPQLRAALLGGVLLVVLDTLVEFDAFVGLRYRTFAIDVYSQYRLSFSASGAAALSSISIVFCVMLLLAEQRLRGGANYTRISHGARRAAARYGLGRTAPLVLAGLTLLVAVGVGLPVGMLVYWLTQSSRVGFAEASESVHELWSVTLTTVGLGVAAALVAVALASPIAFLAVRYRGRIATAIERASYLSFALPDLVAAIALSYGASHYAHFLFGSVVLLVLAYGMLFVPFAVVAVRVTLGQLEPVLEDSARSLGAGAVATLWRVTMPLVRPGLLAAGVLVFALVLGDLSTTQVLAPPELRTLGIAFEENSSTVAFAAAAPFAGALIALAMIAAYVLMSQFGRVRLVGA
jgi:iron(III) transport system permease protein